MGFVVKIHALDHTDIEGYYTGKIKNYRDEEVSVPSVVDDKESDQVKIYKHKKNAENAMNKVLNESSFVSKCSVEEYSTVHKGEDGKFIGEYGLSGYLAPDGVWFSCDYQEHCEKAVELVKRYELRDTDYNNIAVQGEFIKFGTAPWTNKEGCGDCHVFLDRFRMPTESQINWLKQNLNRATDKQKNEVLLTFSAFYEIELELI